MRIRKGNDIEVRWTVNIHDENGDLVDITSLNPGIQLLVGTKVYEITNATISANLVTFIFPGSRQEYDGPYIIKLYDTEDSSITYDVRNAFTLTEHSWEASAEPSTAIVVEIGTDIVMREILVISGPAGQDGADGRDGANGQDGRDGANGHDGIDGHDGANGIDGQDGRDGIDGIDGADGRSIRTTVFSVGKTYYDGTTSTADGLKYLDIVADKSFSIYGDSGESDDDEVHFYLCKTTHLSTSEESLSDTTLWTPLANTGPIVTPIVLAEKIRARYIDVDELVVKHLDGADGTFSGTLSFPFADLIACSTITSKDTDVDPQLGEYGTWHRLIRLNTSASIHIGQEYRVAGNHYHHLPRRQYLTLPSNLPSGVVINILADGYNDHDIFSPVYISATHIYYGTYDGRGEVFLRSNELRFTEQFLIRLLHYGNGEYYLLSSMGPFDEGEESEDSSVEESDNQEIPDSNVEDIADSNIDEIEDSNVEEVADSNVEEVIDQEEE